MGGPTGRGASDRADEMILARKGAKSRKPGTNDDPVVTVTGGSRGIGLEICRQLVARGARVVLTARKRAAGEAAVETLAGGKHAAAFHPLKASRACAIFCKRATATSTS